MKKFKLSIVIWAVLFVAGLASTTAAQTPATNASDPMTSLISRIDGVESFSPEQRVKLEALITQVLEFGRQKGFEEGQHASRKVLMDVLKDYDITPKSPAVKKPSFWEGIAAGLQTAGQSLQQQGSNRINCHSQKVGSSVYMNCY
jgi:hypothetical protein